jgi:predicted DNA-binding transcriptional regulator AlpA
MNVPAEQTSPHGPRTARKSLKSSTAAPTPVTHLGRQGDRSSADDAGARLPVYCRYRDLEEAGIVSSWMMLRRLIERENFPRGLMLGKNSRAWPVREIEAWLAGRPSAPKAVNVDKQMTTRRRRQEAEAAVSAEN